MGEIVSQDYSDYEHARTVYDANIDKKPQDILYCQNAADVVLGVNFARD